MKNFFLYLLEIILKVLGRLFISIIVLTALVFVGAIAIVSNYTNILLYKYRRAKRFLRFRRFLRKLKRLRYGKQFDRPRIHQEKL